MASGDVVRMHGPEWDQVGIVFGGAAGYFLAAVWRMEALTGSIHCENHCRHFAFPVHGGNFVQSRSSTFDVDVHVDGDERFDVQVVFMGHRSILLQGKALAGLLRSGFR